MARQRPQAFRILQRLMWRLQRHLEAFYDLEAAPSAADFLVLGARNTCEQVLVRESDQELHLAVVLPEDCVPRAPADPSDEWAQVIEGVSHFRFLAERARVELPTTQLELELQAEVDKFVVLFPSSPRSADRTDTLCHQLYDRVRYLQPADTEEGARYRLANRLAARLVSRVFGRGSVQDWRRCLRAFYRAGQADKVSMALAI